MSRQIEVKAARAEEAVAGLAAAGTFVAAERCWSDFLVYWHQVLEACDVAGVRRARTDYPRWRDQVKTDPALAYLAAARHADTHTLEGIVDKAESAISLGALGGYDVEVEDAPPGAPTTLRFIPQTDDPPPFLAFFPESIRLLPITGRNPAAVPDAFAYDIGDPPAPIALAETGLVFMRAQMARALG